MVQVFKLAKAFAPSVIYMDEVEKVGTFPMQHTYASIRWSIHMLMQAQKHQQR